MLSAQKSVFKQQVKSCSEDAIYQALYDAMMASLEQDGSNFSGTENESKVKDNRKKMAEEFAKAGKKSFSDKFVDKIVDAIDSYIKAAGITINCPVPSTTVLTSPMGPVTGSISIMPNNVTIS